MTAGAGGRGTNLFTMCCAASGRGGRPFGKPDMGEEDRAGLWTSLRVKGFLSTAGPPGGQRGPPLPTEAQAPPSPGDTRSPQDEGLCVACRAPPRGGRGRRAGPRTATALPGREPPRQPQRRKVAGGHPGPVPAGWGCGHCGPEGLCSVLRDLQSCVPRDGGVSPKDARPPGTGALLGNARDTSRSSCLQTGPIQ